ncbi:hypothetical protein WOLCODRAFT_20643 [Wolfiporia cocos MD-104 SS10]|uniref:Uncharacterized protein n=1 Tax=Wolfiporia cocos (strain MD-104) TaxID=742152 RepID=A0A2H3J9Z5_WOLCO|nr:hypothetical protein WOLCODRAFT_20643 [Wolfiporia cocos MD-104 SS10]
MAVGYIIVLEPVGVNSLVREQIFFSALRIYALCNRRRMLAIVVLMLGLVPAGGNVFLLGVSSYAATGQICVQSVNVSFLTMSRPIIDTSMFARRDYKRKHESSVTTLLISRFILNLRDASFACDDRPTDVEKSRGDVTSSVQFAFDSFNTPISCPSAAWECMDVSLGSSHLVQGSIRTAEFGSCGDTSIEEYSPGEQHADGQAARDM